MYRIAKSFHFSASHTLSLPPPHPCSRLHGHNYVVEVVLETERLDLRGFVVDYGELKQLRDFVDSTYDHRHLNDVVPFEPTAENLAEEIFRFAKSRWPQTVRVRLSETPATWAEFEGSEPTPTREDAV